MCAPLAPALAPSPSASNGGLDAWVLHGARAGARAAAVAAEVRASRAAAEDELSGALRGPCSAFAAASALRSEDSTLHLRAVHVTRTDASLRGALRKRRHDAQQRIAGMELALVRHRERVRRREQEEREQRVQAQEAARARESQNAQERMQAAKAAAQEKERREREEAEENKRREEARRIELLTEATAAAAASAKAVEIAVPGTARSEKRRSTQSAWPADSTATLAAFERLLEEGDEFRKSKDAGTKRTRLALRKAINLAGNQVAASEKQIARSVQALVRTLREAATNSAAAHTFAVAEVAQRLVSEGGTGAPGAAVFAVAAVIAGVAAHAPDSALMVGAFRGAFLKECMYIAPAAPLRKQGEAEEDFRRRIGCPKGEGKEGYVKRMAGFVGLFGALVQTAVARGGPRPMRNPFDVSEGWTWLARIVNKRQQYITPTIVVAFLETAGYEMSKLYKKQFAKLMAIVQNVVLDRAVKGTPPGPHANLDALITEFIKMQCQFRNRPHGQVFPVSDAEF